MNRLALTILALALCSCGPQLGRLNEGAALPVTTIVDADMASLVPSKMGQMTLGAYRHSGALGEIFLLHCGENRWTLAHESAHAWSRLGGSYASVLEAMTPPNPTPEMAERLAICWEIERMGPNPWQSIKIKWGASAVHHPEILATLQ